VGCTHWPERMSSLSSRGDKAVVEVLINVGEDCGFVKFQWRIFFILSKFSNSRFPKRRVVPGEGEN